MVDNDTSILVFINLVLVSICENMENSEKSIENIKDESRKNQLVRT